MVDRFVLAFLSFFLLILDKEMAEEKCDSLQQEIDSLKEKVEEMTLDLEILRGEKEQGGQASSTSSVEFVQLEKQNERLKEALVKLRDVTTEEKLELSKRLKEVEKVAADVPSLTAKLEKFKTEVWIDLLKIVAWLLCCHEPNPLLCPSQCHEYEEQVETLKESLDDALSAQDMVEQLTEKNLALEDKIQELRGQLEELEVIFSCTLSLPARFHLLFDYRPFNN